MREIRINLKSETETNTKSYKLCVGGGRAYETLGAENQRHLKLVADQCGFRYLRFHGVLNDEMAVYNEDAQGNPIYNWQYVDLVYDYILSIGMKPFVELSFMPTPMASGEPTLFFWRGNVTMPKSIEKWGNLIEALVQHWTDRYGKDEVDSWFFEVWNEPNLEFFFSTTNLYEDYMKLYKAAAEAVKRVSPGYRVGGPATAGCEWIPEFIERCFSEQIPLDFVSTHAYGLEGYVDECGRCIQKVIADPDSISSDIIRTAEIIKKSSMPDLPLHFTEWNSSYSSRDPIHDSYHQAAYLLTRIRKAFRSVASMAYWAFSDIFEEAGPGLRPFHGGFGLVNIQGLLKPSFHIYRFLNMLSDNLLPCDDLYTFATCDKTGTQVLFWDYTIPEQDESDEEYYVRDLPSGKAPTARVELTGLQPGSYLFSLYGVGYRLNDVYTLYRDLGKTSSMSKDCYEFLSENASGRPIQTKLVNVGDDGRFTLTQDMRENDVYFFKLTRLDRSACPSKDA